MSEKIEAKSKGTSRREFIAATGAAVAGLAVGAVIGSQAFPKVVELAGVTRTETATRTTTATVTAPGAATTVTAPGVATTVTAPGATTTVTAPGAATTTTVTAPAATTTVTVAAPAMKYPYIPYCTTEQGISRVEAPKPTAATPLTFNHDFAKCTGCRLCEMACVKQHYGNVFNPQLSRVQVYWYYPGPMAIPVNCWNCTDTPCVKVCPVTPPAIYQDAKKLIIKVDKARCLGYKCGKCAAECKDKRADAIHFYPPDHDYAIVCDHCDGAGPGGEPEPQCVKICGPKVFQYWTSILLGNLTKTVKNHKQIAADLARQYYPITKEKRMKYPSELGL